MSGLDASKLTRSLVKERKVYPKNEDLVFGKIMTDHMLVADWDATEGWQAPQIVPYAPFAMDPASGALHYAFECFEGQKAFRDVHGKVRVFRPQNNMARLNKSCARIALPTFDIEEATKLLLEFVRTEESIIPEGRGYSLYLRPSVIATSASLGVGPSSKARFFIIASPVGAIAGTSNGAMRLKATDEYVRAWPGGTGNAKVGGNYAPCVVPAQIAAKEGFQQNLWVFDGHVTEVGMMNLFVVLGNEDGTRELATAPLDGLILEGITRLSILELARERLDPKVWKVSERPILISEIKERAAKNQLLEVFGAGTAAIVSPVKEINYRGEPYLASTGDNAGEFTQLARKWIQDIQYGVEEHPFTKTI